MVIEAVFVLAFGFVLAAGLWLASWGFSGS
jgi:hypothetical protein